MSVKHIAWVWEHSHADKGTLLVALALADSVNATNEDDWCWPRQDKIAEMVRLTTDTVSRCVKELEALGEIEIRRTQNGNRYRFLHVGLASAPPGPGSCADMTCERHHPAKSRIGVDAGLLADSTPDLDSAPTPDPYVEPEVEPEGTRTDAATGQGALLPLPLDELWDYYRERIPEGQKQRTTTRNAEIRKALKARTLDECKRAIDGLASSDYHHGRNPEHRTYLELEYALGKLKWEQDRCGDKIDNMGKRATVPVADRTTGEVPITELLAKYEGYMRELVHGKMLDVRRGHTDPDSKMLTDIAAEAVEWLRERDIIVVGTEGSRIRWGRA